ncbi:MAG TPA: B-box zinc finger protein [Bryobacteraceae bacterium]|nr:B-box zinc finger protein [Bryobacteraceae bacterium]
MNCLNHPETPATAYCRTCGRPLCAECKRSSQGVIYCEEHVPPASAYAAAPAPGPTPGTAQDVSPGLACLLGFIPGVGAIYNGQYAKGLVHAVIFGLVVSIISSDAAGGLEPLFGILLTAWIFYMALEAYHTAKKRRAGESVDEFSSLVDLHGRRNGGFPAGAVALILLGALLLLNTLEILHFRYMIRYWPVLLILAGVWMLYTRMSPDPKDAEVGHERR